jgi:hypothetical protein
MIKHIGPSSFEFCPSVLVWQPSLQKQKGHVASEGMPTHALDVGSDRVEILSPTFF